MEASSMAFKVAFFCSSSATVLRRVVMISIGVMGTFGSVPTGVFSFHFLGGKDELLATGATEAEDEDELLATGASATEDEDELLATSTTATSTTFGGSYI
jgi:hypothetical protein